MKTNPLANHGELAVNAIEACRLQKPKHLKDIVTSRRFIFEALQKAGVVPLGAPHDMETCSVVEELLQRVMDKADSRSVVRTRESNMFACSRQTRGAPPNPSLW